MTTLIRGLTLRHPWPRMFLLDDGPKRIENRDWPAPARMIGQHIALHGGLPPKPKDGAYFTEIRQALNWVADVFEDPDPASTFSDAELLSEFCIPGIFGVARLTEVVSHSDDPWFAGPFGWVLSDFVPIEPPLVDRSPSHQRLWEIEPGTLAELRRRYAEARRPAPAPDPARGVLARVAAGSPLCSADHAAVLALIGQGLMHVTPEFDRSDPCPYRLTDAGRAVLAQTNRERQNI